MRARNLSDLPYASLEDPEVPAARRGQVWTNSEPEPIGVRRGDFPDGVPKLAVRPGDVGNCPLAAPPLPQRQQANHEKPEALFRGHGAGLQAAGGRRQRASTGRNQAGGDDRLPMVEPAEKMDRHRRERGRTPDPDPWRKRRTCALRRLPAILGGPLMSMSRAGIEPAWPAMASGF